MVARLFVQTDRPLNPALEIEVDAVHPPRLHRKAVLVEEKPRRRAGQGSFFEDFLVDALLDGFAVIYLPAREAPFAGGVARVLPPQDEYPAITVRDDQP